MFREFCEFCVRLLYIVLLINLFHAKSAELADFASRTIPDTYYSKVGIRRPCRRLCHDGHADVKTTPHQLRLWVVVVYNAVYATHYVVNIKIDEQSYLFIG